MRYIPITDADKEQMLKEIGVRSTDELFQDIPAAVRLGRALNLPPALSEMEIMAHIRELAGRNVHAGDHACFLGAGAYDHYQPALVDHIIRRGEFLTAYTPYQPEISQGVLQVIYEWQTLVAQLTGMDVANASMYEGASALAEASVMALDLTGRTRVVVSRTVHPEYRAVLRTYLSGLGVSLLEAPYDNGITDLAQLEALLDDETSALVVQTPNFFGCLEPVYEMERLIHKQGGLYVVSPDPISLGLLAPPGEYGADIVAFEGQPLGIPLQYGGPYVGVIGTRDKYLRRLPGRLAGATVDTRGQRAFVLTLQAREQHIRREKATSNICTNQALLALAATVYMCWLGPNGLKEVAAQSLQKAHYAHDQLAAIPGWAPAFSAPFFLEFTLRCPVSPVLLNQHLLKHRIIGGYHPAREYPELGNATIIAVTEKRTRAEIDRLVTAAQEGSAA